MINFFGATQNKTSSIPNVPELDYQPVIIIAGQSNALGTDTGAQLDDRLNGIIHGTKIWKNSTSQFIETQIGQYEQGSIHGAELMLAFKLKQYYQNNTPYIIKYTVGGTSLHTDWKYNTGTLYNELLSRVSSALLVLDGLSVNYKIHCIYWNQGEQDTLSLPAGEAYEQNLIDLFTGLRLDLQTANNAMCITCRLSNEYMQRGNPGGYKVRNAQQAVGGLLNNRYHSQDDIPFLNSVHFSSNGQNVIGNKVFGLITGINLNGI